MSKKVLIIKDPENAMIEIIVDGERIFIGNYFEFKPEFDLYNVLNKVSDNVEFLIKRGIR